MTSGQKIVLFIGVVILAALFLSGCYSEGALFQNSGAYANQRQCMRVDQFGHEVWFSVPANRQCPSSRGSR